GDTALSLTHPVLGNIVLEKKNLKSWNQEPPSPRNDASTAANATTADVPATPSAQSGWKRKVGLGIYGNGSSGDSTSTNLHLFFDSEYERGKDRWLFKTAYDLQSKGGETTENKYFGQLDRDWTTPGSHWFWTARGRFDWDDFKEWGYRLGGFVGPGYQFLDNDTWSIRGRSGLGGTYTWKGEEKGFQPEGQLGMDLTWKISPSHSLDANTMFYLDLDRLSHFRNTTSLGWNIDIDQIYRGLAFKFGITNEYESNVAADDAHNDFKYRFSVLLGL
ncbi:MAG TPA: DUF481 domain-containing protein, partial [Chromatiales bacterium]|nr:DUF481 domain-containing protein [Chromatiales bacterium]